MPRTWILYHVKDLDGHCAGAIAKYYYKNIEGTMPNMVPFDYGYKMPSDIKEEDRIVFVDIAPTPYEKTFDLIESRKNNGEVIIVDHHKSYIDFLGSNQPKGVQKVGQSGCELAWNYFIKSTKNLMMPDFVRLLGRYDVWDQSNMNKWNTEILPFQYGMRAEDTDPQNDRLLDKLVNKYMSASWADSHSPIKDIITAGKTIIKYQEKQDENNMSMFSFESTFDGYSAICLNSPRCTSNTFDSKYDPDRHDIMFNFVFDGSKYTISLYSDREEMQCQEIARKFGGGGHPKAAGFTAKEIHFKDGQITVEI